MKAYAPPSGCSTGCLPRAGDTPQVGALVRALRLLAFVLTLVLGVVVALLQPVVRGRLIRGWFRLLLRSTGVLLVLRGDATASAPSRTGTLVAANHVSWLDIPATLAVESLRVVAKSDVRRWPIIGPLAAAGGTVFIDRRRLLRLPTTVADIATALRAGHSVLVFPEGTTWCGRTHGRFYPAAFQAAVDVGAPVRPVLLRYRLADGSVTTAPAFLGNETLLASVLRVIAVRGLTVEIDLAPVIATSQAAPVRAGVATRRSMAARTAAIVGSAAMLHDLGTSHPAGGSSRANATSSCSRA